MYYITLNLQNIYKLQLKLVYPILKKYKNLLPDLIFFNFLIFHTLIIYKFYKLLNKFNIIFIFQLLFYVFNCWREGGIKFSLNLFSIKERIFLSLKLSVRNCKKILLIIFISKLFISFFCVLIMAFYFIRNINTQIHKVKG